MAAIVVFPGANPDYVCTRVHQGFGAELYQKGPYPLSLDVGFDAHIANQTHYVVLKAHRLVDLD